MGGVAIDDHEEVGDVSGSFREPVDQSLFRASEVQGDKNTR